jgi:hypothetical protein
VRTGSVARSTTRSPSFAAWHCTTAKTSLRSLARFVAAGNTLVVVRGNHDVDFHWTPVQEAFTALLAGYAATTAGSVEFADWFYYEEGRVYIEHGHQYDAYCSYDHVLHPVLPSDPRRSQPSL